MESLPRYVLVEESNAGRRVHNPRGEQDMYEDLPAARRDRDQWQADADALGVPVQIDVYEIRRVG